MKSNRIMKKHILSILGSFALLCMAGCSENEADNIPVFPENMGGLNMVAGMSTE